METRQIRLLGYALGLALLLTTTAVSAAPGKVNINSASVDELALLPRVGPSVAGRIVEFRDSNGRFKALEDLMLVRGIGEKTFELIKPYVKLDGEWKIRQTGYERTFELILPFTEGPGVSLRTRWNS